MFISLKLCIIEKFISHVTIHFCDKGIGTQHWVSQGSTVLGESSGPMGKHISRLPLCLWNEFVLRNVLFSTSFLTEERLFILKNFIFVFLISGCGQKWACIRCWVKARWPHHTCKWRGKSYSGNSKTFESFYFPADCISPKYFTDISFRHFWRTWKCCSLHVLKHSGAPWRTAIE